MKKILKIFCCALAVCSVNVGVVKADTIIMKNFGKTFNKKERILYQKL